MNIKLWWKEYFNWKWIDSKWKIKIKELITRKKVKDIIVIYTDTGVMNFYKVKMNEQIIYNELGKKTHKIDSE